MVAGPGESSRPDGPGSEGSLRPGGTGPRWDRFGAAVRQALNDKRWQQQIMLAGGIFFGLAVGAYLVIARGHPRSQWSMLDLRVYHWAGVRARAGFNAYKGTYRGLSFTYTPFALLLTAVGSVPNLPLLRWLLTGVSFLVLVATMWAAWGMVGVQRSRGRLGLALGMAGVAIWMEPLEQTLSFGQINLILMALVLIDLCQPDTRRWKGLGVGLAAGIKLTPAFFIAFLVLTRRWRAAGVAVGAFVATFLLGFAIFPSESSKYWFGGLFANSQRVGGVGYVGNQSLNGMLVRLLHSVSAAEPWWVLASVAVGAFGLLLSVWASRAGEELLAVTVCALAGLLVSPISWSHHWVWIAPGIVVAIDLAILRGYRAGWALLIGLAGLFAAGPVLVIWQVPNSHNREYHWHTWQLLVGNAYILIGLGLLAAAFVGLRRWRQAGVPHVGPSSVRAPAEPGVPGSLALQRR